MTPVSEQLKLDVTIPAEGGTELGAWLFLPEGDGIRAAITMAHGFGGTREHGLERFGHSPRQGSLCLCTIIAILGRAAGTSAGTSIHGNKLRTGVVQFLTLRDARKLIRLVLVYGAPAMPADTLSCLAQQIGACAAS
jgi:cephalosporin-C deacetylase-like acetyl esterase